MRSFLRILFLTSLAIVLALAATHSAQAQPSHYTFTRIANLTHISFLISV